MVTRKFAAIITPEKKLVIEDEQAFRQHLFVLSGSGDNQVDVIVTKRRKRKSRNQRDYYWGVMLNILAEYTGHTREELHDALKHKFLSYTDGNNIVLTRSTEELSTVECEEYYEDIKRWAAGELNLFIPDPGDAYGVL